MSKQEQANKQYLDKYALSGTTVHGCKCKSWKTNGKNYEGCIQGNDKHINKNCPPIKMGEKTNLKCYEHWKYEPWCRIDSESCGYSKGRGADDKGDTRWDFCEWKGLWKYNKDRNASLPSNKLRWNILGLLLYLFIFGIICPAIFKYMGWNELTEVWIPNLDLMATVMSFKNGFFDSRLFAFLYDTSTSTNFEYWSRLVINYISILGVVYIAGSRIAETDKVSEGLSFALVMVICTYLVPNDFITETMNHLFYKNIMEL